MCGVVKQRSSRAPREASAAWSSIERLCDGKSGCVITISRTPSSSAASTTAKISSRERWPVASTRPCRATVRSTARVSGSTAPSASTTATGSSSRPAARSSRWSSIQTGILAPGGNCVSSPLSLTESTVGSQTVRAPSRAAISTATGFIPPTARLSAIAPSTSTPGTAARTTAARSAVEV